MHAAYKVEYEALNRPNSHLARKFCNSIGFLPRKSGIRDMSCLSVCLLSQGNSNPSNTWSQNAPGCDVYSVRNGSRHTYRQSGPTFGFNGALLLIELRDPAPPGAIAFVPGSVRAAKYLANWLLQRIDPNESGITL